MVGRVLVHAATCVVALLLRWIPRQSRGLTCLPPSLPLSLSPLLLVSPSPCLLVSPRPFSHRGQRVKLGGGHAPCDHHRR